MKRLQSAKSTDMMQSMETSGTELNGTSLPFDTLSMAKHLRRHGYSKEQAEGQVELLKYVIESYLATKTDLAKVEAALKTDLASLEAALKIEIANVEATLKRDIQELRKELKTDISEVRRDMKEMEYRMTIKLGAIVAAIVGFFTVMDKFL